MNSFTRQTLAGLRLMIVMTVLLGVLYPAVVWGVGQVAARDQAAGSLVQADGRTVGSALLGQQFTGDAWFASRPSASDSSGDVSGGTNLGPGADLDAAVAERARAAGLTVGTAAPDALTASASGLDPHVSPENAAAQVARVAAARGLPASEVQQLVTANTEGRQLGFLGEPRVNVLRLNLALQALAPTKGA
ncbi:K+-transporting ATPase ATPase C chain [Terracoccus luteus]|jgi:K+-transporting ATPase ATPase C chain|uniref:Potassium-transporting ATPase KdpC subunit n=1 Tax=Terracoccus luteus TaxID=53356 RepID=A0A495XUJ7_9MICO|nr:K(+)-transporting ATPase subunit C [Terracoccus luteus]RKT77622.1 K+-transporting ATPase ATPase C chain [Terracoccus luteus]